jgi:hypothetical protein
MATSVLHRIRGKGNRRIQSIGSWPRIFGLLAILGLAAVASLRAQDKTPPVGAPKGAAPNSLGGQAPSPAVPTAEPVPQPAAPHVILAGENGTLTEVALAKVAQRRFQFTIAPNTPLKDLLPTPPAAKTSAGPLIAKDLMQVPEIEFQLPLDKKRPSEEALKQTAHTMAKINHLNDQKMDGFLDALRHERPDLHGMPFAMGDACRTKGDRSKQFAIEVARVRGALQERQPGAAAAFTTSLDIPPPVVGSGPGSPATALAPQQAVPPPAPTAPASGSSAPTPQPVNPPGGNSTTVPVQPAAPGGGGPPIPAQSPSGPVSGTTPIQAPFTFSDVVNTFQVSFANSNATNRVSPEKFWEQYQTACANHDQTLSRADKCQQENVTLTRIAALMQALAPESPGIRAGLVKSLSGISHAEATRALAKLAIFSAEENVRQRALDALKIRRERDYTDILLGGLRYPWPDVARHAADALIKLERTDLVPQLVDLLDDPDPRAPVVREENNKRVQEVRELIRVNHHRNCLLCHAPANTGNVASDTLTAAVPVPQDALPSPSQGYQNSLPDLLVRIDVTYLRQDFSMFQPVADANPWPEMQRFDFLVRTRQLTEKEADAYRDKLSIKEPGVLSPYHRAALAALRELTGRDTAPTSDAWRELLKLPPKPVRTALAR